MPVSEKCLRANDWALKVLVHGNFFWVEMHDLCQNIPTISGCWLLPIVPIWQLFGHMHLHYYFNLIGNKFLNSSFDCLKEETFLFVCLFVINQLFNHDFPGPCA